MNEMNDEMINNGAEPELTTETEPQAESAPSPAEKPKKAAKFKEYQAKIAVAALNVRKGPGMTFPIATTLVNDADFHIIAEESEGDKATWGRLKSGLGWVNLNYIKKK